MGRHRRNKRAAKPVRTGLLGVSAAVALGAAAVASGVLPGTDDYRLDFGSDSAPEKVQAADVTGDVRSHGGATKTPERQDDAAARDEQRESPSAEPSKTAEKPSPTPSRTAESEAPEKEAADKTEKPAKERTEAPEKPAAPSTPDTQSGAEAQVVALVNQERAQAGCSPVTADGDLAELASDFSADMAARGFFDHTDPDGDTPWDRAAAVGIANLGGENIARGQADAKAVMDSWMESPGHRANILNCDYKTLGVGAHFGEGGPWWTQDFGF